ncbi:MAG: KEOPS complex subunit Cgi121 [Thermoplasmata archaeon]
MSGGCNYTIFGAEGERENILERLREVAEGALVFDADWILGREHIEVALYHATRAHARKIHKVNTFENCVFLYVGLSDQIYEARERVGVKPGTRHFAFVLPEGIEKESVLRELGLRENEEVLAFTEEKARKIFTKEELEATPVSRWKLLVYERIALLNIQ